MSDEVRLPDDLAACEARLAAHSPGASRLNRDELMYRAGWAAAEAQLARTSAVSPTLVAGSHRAAAWSLASAALAASLAVAATLSIVRPAPAPQVAEPHRDSPAQPAIARRESGLPMLPVQPPAAAGLLSRLESLIARNAGAVRPTPATALFALSRGSRRGGSDLPILASTGADSSTAAPIEFVTARQLLDEYLPRGAGAASPGGGSTPSILDLLRPLGGSEDTI